MLFKQNSLVRQWAECNAPFASDSNRGPKDGPRWIIGCGNGSAASIALGRRVAGHLEAAKVTTDPDGGRRGFGATKPGTMTSWAQRQGATAIQIEVSRSYRAAQSADRLKERLITGLMAALLEEKKRLATISVDTLVA